MAILLAAATLLLAALLIWQCIDIYAEGTCASNLTSAGARIHDIFSPEIVHRRFSRLSWALGLWLAALVAAMIERIVKPLDGKAATAMPPQCRLKVLKARREMTEPMRREERARRIAFGIAWAFCALCALGGGAYLVNRDHFSSRDLEPVMAQMLSHVAPWVIAAFAAQIAAAQYAHKCLLRELEAAKSAPKRAALARSAPKSAPVTPIQIALGLAALALIALGVLNGGMWDVLVKAINICTECVGLG